MKHVLIGILAGLLLAGCTISQGVVKDVKVTEHEVIQEKCDLRLWFALYVIIITGEGNCRTERAAR